MEVVQPMGQAVGSSYSMGVDESEVPMTGNSDSSDSGLVSGRRGSGADSLPMFDAETASDIDVPTFLRRQAD